jgi:Uma2 family endonuclease
MRIVARVPPFDRPATYDDLLRLPEHLVAEIVDGELHAVPRPAPRHTVAYSRLAGILGPPFDQGCGGPAGWWILCEPELHLGPVPDVLVPDLAGWRRSRMPELPSTAYFPLAPDWICEILSPSTAAFDRTKKLAAYRREHVAHAWLLDPIARTLEVLHLEDSRWVILAVHAGDVVVRADPFAAIEIDLRALWGPAEA